MSDTLQTDPPPRPSDDLGHRARRHAEHVRPGFVISKRFDLTFFLLPPVATALFLLLQRLAPAVSFTICALVWVGLAQSHFGATLLFYLSGDNLDHYRRARHIYFVIPALIVIGFIGIGLTPMAGGALALVPIASFWHGSRQSFGVAGLYRGLSAAFGRDSRTIEMATIFAGGACFTAAGAVRLGMIPAADSVMSTASTLGVVALARHVWWIGFAFASAMLIVSLGHAVAQSRAAGVAAAPRCVALVAAWGMYAPYVVAADPLSAFLAALIPHYMQYHGLLYLIHRNKVDAGEVAHDDLIRHVVRAPLAYIATTVGFAVALGAALVVLDHLDRTQLGLCLVAGVNVAHFWLDGFLWRFRDPHVRQSTLRFMRPQTALQPTAPER